MADDIKYGLKVGAETKDAETKLARFNARVKKVGANLTKYLKRGLIAVAGAFATAGFVAAKSAGKMEQWRIAFETMTGSAEDADKILRKITKFAASTPFELPGLVESSKQLLAFGISIDEIIPTMKSLGDISAGVGTDKLPTLVRAFGKIRTKGKATMEELNMILEAGVPILDSLAAGYNVTVEKLFKMISAGKVGFTEVDAALKRLTTGNGKFAGLMEKQSKSFFGIISNIKDNITQTAIALGDEMLPKLKDIARAIKDFTSTDRLPKFIRNLKFWLVDMETRIRIAMETIKEVIAEPFKFDTYKTIFRGLISQAGRYMGILRGVLVKGAKWAISELKKIREAEKLEGLSLEQEIINIKQDAADKKLAIEQEYQVKVAELRAGEVEDVKSKSKEIGVIYKKQATFTEALAKSITNNLKDVNKDFMENLKANTEDMNTAIKDSFKEMALSHLAALRGDLLAQTAVDVARAVGAKNFAHAAQVSAQGAVALGVVEGSMGAIRGLETGGIVAGEQIARIGEKGKQEAVIPLESAQGRRALSNAVGRDNGGAVNQNVTLEIDGMKLAEIMLNKTEAGKRQGRF